MSLVPGANRIELAVQVSLAVELGLVWLHGVFPGLTFLPLDGSEIAQIALVIVPALVMAELFHWGRVAWHTIRSLWRGS